MKKTLLFVTIIFTVMVTVNSQVVLTDLRNNPVNITSEYEINFFGSESEFMIQNYSAEGEAVYFASFSDGAAVVSTQADYNANVDVMVENTVIGSSSVFFGCQGGSPYFNVLYLPNVYTSWANYFVPQYVGFKFKHGNDTHYGWAELQVSKIDNSSDEVQVTLYGYAYESTPDKSIQAGSTVSVGLNDESGNLSVSLYPNPADQYLSIDSDIQINKAEIFDVQGRKILNIEGDIKNIDLSYLEKGTYFVKVFSDDKIIQNKFIKQ